MMIVYLMLASSALPACLSGLASSKGYLAGGGGARIFYRVVGRGSDTIVAIHGGPGGDMNNIAPDLERLAHRHTVIYYDQRGGGRSELPADTALLDAPGTGLMSTAQMCSLRRSILFSAAAGPRVRFR
jgi:proline iminopeptidase